MSFARFGSSTKTTAACARFERRDQLLFAIVVIANFSHALLQLRERPELFGAHPGERVGTPLERIDDGTFLAHAGAAKQNCILAPAVDAVALIRSLNHRRHVSFESATQHLVRFVDDHVL